MVWIGGLFVEQRSFTCARVPLLFTYINSDLFGKWQRNSLLFFHSAQCLVEMEQKNAQWSVVEGKGNVTLEPNHMPEPAVILVLVLNGKLEIGVR